VGIVFLITGAALFAASLLTGSDWLLAVTNLLIGVEAERSGPPAGVISITLGLLLLLLLWNRRRRRKRERPAAAGVKSRALRDAVVRRMRDHAIPVPA
jgi:MYXO-CTERM domain-containing protein